MALEDDIGRAEGDEGDPPFSYDDALQTQPPPDTNTRAAHGGPPPDPIHQHQQQQHRLSPVPPQQAPHANQRTHQQSEQPHQPHQQSQQNQQRPRQQPQHLQQPRQHHHQLPGHHQQTDQQPDQQLNQQYQPQYHSQDPHIPQNPQNPLNPQTPQYTLIQSQPQHQYLTRHQVQHQAQHQARLSGPHTEAPVTPTPFPLTDTSLTYPEPDATLLIPSDRKAKRQPRGQQAKPMAKKRATEPAQPGRLWTLLKLQDDEEATQEKLCKGLCETLTTALEPGTRKQQPVFVVSKEAGEDLKTLASALLRSVIASTTPPPIETLTTFMTEIKNGLMNLDRKFSAGSDTVNPTSIQASTADQQQQQCQQNPSQTLKPAPGRAIKRLPPAARAPPPKPGASEQGQTSWATVAARGPRGSKPGPQSQATGPHPPPRGTLNRQPTPTYAARHERTSITLSQPQPLGTAMLNIPITGLVRGFNNLMAAKRIQGQPTGVPIYARAAFRHASNNITFHFASAEEADLAKATVTQWLPALNPSLQYRPTRHSVVVHGIPTTFNPQDPESKEELKLSNPDTLNDDFTIRWVNHRSATDGRRWAALMINLKDAASAARVVEQSVWFCDGPKATAHCLKPPTRCYNCVQPGHAAFSCPAPPTCQFCSGAHKSTTCTQRGPDSPQFCTACTRRFISLNPQMDVQTYLRTGPTDLQHSPFAEACPTATLAWETRARLAQESSPKLLLQQKEVPVNHPNAPIVLASEQEPYTLPGSNLPMSNPNWELLTPYYPGRETPAETHRVRACLYVRKALRLDVEAIPSGLRDVAAASINTPTGRISILNTYNQPKTFTAFQMTEALLRPPTASPAQPTILVTDSNLHHSIWNPPGLKKHDPEADQLVDMMASHNFRLISPQGVPTFTGSNPRMTNHPTIDLAWANSEALELIVTCKVDSGVHSHNSDHLGILTTLDTRKSTPGKTPVRNSDGRAWRMVQRETFVKDVATRLGPPPPLSTKAETERFAIRLTATVTSCLDDHSPAHKASFKVKRWWNGETLNPLKRDANKLRRIFQRTRQLEDYENYVRAKKTFHDRILEEKNSHRAKYLESLTASNLFTAYKYTQGDPSINPRLDYLKANGTQCRSNAERAQALFDTTCTAFAPCDSSDVEEQVRTDPTHGRELLNLSSSEILRCLESTHPTKAPGPDRIQTWVWQLLWKKLQNHITGLFNACIRHGSFPSSWKTARTIMIPKPGKPDYACASAYRPIALLNTLAKLLEKTMTRCLTAFAEEMAILPTGHYGGWAERSGPEACAHLTSWIKDCWREGKMVGGVFADVKSAFPSVHHVRLLSTLCTQKFHPQLILFIESFLANRNTYLCFNNFESEKFELTHGLPQGSLLSPILYILYNSSLLTIADNHMDSLALGYIDNVVLLTTAKHPDDLKTRVQAIITDQLRWADKHGAIFDTNKSQWVIFSKRRFPTTLTVDFADRENLGPVAETKWLGILFDSQLTFRNQRLASLKRGETRVAYIKSLTHQQGGCPPALACTLLTTTVHTVTDYGAPIWANFDPAPWFAEAMQKVDNKGLRLALGCLHTTPAEFLHHDLNMPKTKHRLMKKAETFFVKTLTRPASHPLYDIIRRSRQQVEVEGGPELPHKNPFHLFFGHHIAQKEWKSTLRFTTPPLTNQPPPPNLSALIRPTKKAAFRDAKRLKPSLAHTVIYTDGSRTSTHTGAAAFCTNDSTRRRRNLGPADLHSIYNGELVGIELGLQLSLLRCDNPALRCISILLDNQSAIEGTVDQHDTPWNATHRRRSHLIAQSIFLCRPDVKIVLRWCPGHKGIPGNEEADRLAKSTASLTPTHPLTPSSGAAALAAITRWATPMFTEAERKRLRGAPDPKGTFKALSGLTRNHASLIVQARSDHLPLNSYLHRFGEVPNPLCDCLLHAEDVTHVLLACPRWQLQREQLHAGLFAKGKTLNNTTLTDPQSFRLVAEFLAGTRRLEKRWIWSKGRF